ncbi:MAG TPA: phosphotransferase [bacterium]|nr:phosphotransferase [bacterium]
MAAGYLGTLDRADPLYDVLAVRVYPEISNPVFHVERLSGHRLVFRYREERTNRAIVAKFFNMHDPDPTKIMRIKSEYRNLIRLRYLGLNAHPHYVVNPLCREERIGLAVAEEFVRGPDLDHYLKRAVAVDAGTALRPVLGRLATFLYLLHSKTSGTVCAPLEGVAGYFFRIADKLLRQQVIAVDHVWGFLALRDRWLVRPCMVAEAVTVHGDATPTNFLFPNSEDVVAIDLERMKQTDRVYDIGMVCGELKHAFLWRTGSGLASEPFIRHFLKRYCYHFPSPHDAFREITRRLPFYMGLTELRIARNPWLDWAYRKRLVWEAHECLAWGLQV